MIRTVAALLLATTTLTAQDGFDSQMRSFISAFALASSNAADPVNTEQAFYAGAIPRLLSRLDPHSVFFDKDQFEQLRRMGWQPPPEALAEAIRLVSQGAER